MARSRIPHASDSSTYASGSIGALVEFLIGRPWNQPPTKTFLGWPPDTFAVAATLLRETGAYVNVTGDWPRGRNRDVYVNEIKATQLAWGERLGPGEFQAPDLVVKLWQAVYSHRANPLTDAADVWEALVRLCAIADDASGRLLPISFDADELLSAKRSNGNGRTRRSPLPWQVKQWIMENLLGMLPNSQGPRKHNLCSPDFADRMVVFPKMRTPQQGLTLRSFSHNLALLPNAEVWPRMSFALPSGERLCHSMNLLVFPWPMKVHPAQFHSLDSAPEHPVDRQRFFRFEMQGDPDDLAALVVRVHREATRMCRRIDGVVFPEMALTPAAFDLIARRLTERDIVMVVGGVYEPPVGATSGRNVARISIHKEYQGYVREQNKHHRWKLDDGQIRTYGLGSMLNPRFDWWEYIDIGQRTLEFLQLERSLTMAVLICEDLARPDPVGDVLRAVGPNLVIALLQDGPQLASRWSARYATVLADDPGSSVLTLTGLGMVELSRPHGKPQSRCVALWKDADHEAREIDLPPGAEALVLCLSHESRDQWTADGRRNGERKGHVTLSGVHPVRLT